MVNGKLYRRKMKLKVTRVWRQRWLTQPHFQLIKTVINTKIPTKTSVEDTVLGRDIMKTEKITKVIIFTLMKVPTDTKKMTIEIQNQQKIVKVETPVQNIEMITAEMARDLKSTPIVGRRIQVTMTMLTTMVQTGTTQMKPTAAIKNHPAYKKGC